MLSFSSHGTTSTAGRCVAVGKVELSLLLHSQWLQRIAGKCVLEWDCPNKECPAPLLKDLFGGERRKAKVLNFSIAYGKTAHGLSRDWGTSLKEAEATVDRWYASRPEVSWPGIRTIPATHVRDHSRELRAESCAAVAQRLLPASGHGCSSDPVLSEMLCQSTWKMSTTRSSSLVHCQYVGMATPTCTCRPRMRSCMPGCLKCIGVCVHVTGAELADHPAGPGQG